MTRILPLIAVLGLVALPALEADAQVRRSLKVIGPQIHGQSVVQKQKALQSTKAKRAREKGDRAASSGAAEKMPPKSKEN